MEIIIEKKGEAVQPKYQFYVIGSRTDLIIPEWNIFFYNQTLIIIQMFKKKQTKELSDLLKKNGQQFIYPYLDAQSLLNLGLTSKKYYLLMAPLLTSFSLSKVQQPKQETKKKPKTKPQVAKKEEIEVQITTTPIWKAKKKLLSGQWVKINELPFENSYLQKKKENGVAFFYQNKETAEIFFVNRSMVDPNLNYSHGGFEGDEPFYEDDMFHNLNEIDFSSPEALKNRQKEVISRIEKKKEEIVKLQEIDYEAELVKSLNYNKVAVILCFGGSFSFSIYQNGKSILHKSDKKYVCRKKAGERQLNRDKQSGSNIQSMGSQIRRDQEKKHMENVSKILKENKGAIDECDVVFLQAPGLNRLFVINVDETLSGCKEKLRSVCLTAKKANYSEVEALFQEIGKIHFVTQKH